MYIYLLHTYISSCIHIFIYIYTYIAIYIYIAFTYILLTYVLLNTYIVIYEVYTNVDAYVFSTHGTPPGWMLDVGCSTLDGSAAMAPQQSSYGRSKAENRSFVRSCVRSLVQHTV